MSQNDFNLANQGFPQMRSDMNSALQALASNSSGATAPSTTYAYQWWYDDANDILKFRNGDNDAWIDFATFDQATDSWSFTSVDIKGGTIDGTVIGGTTAAAISGTTGAFSGDVTVPSINGGPLAGFRNAIINGNFDHWQRGTSFTGAVYTSDRWKASFGGGTTNHVSRQAFSVGQTDVPNEPEFYLRNTVVSTAASGAQASLLQNIENVRTFAGQNVTLSFWAKADAAKNIALDFNQDFGASGSANVNAIGAQKFALTTSWQKFTTTVAITSIAGKTVNDASYLEMRFWLDAGSNFNARTNSLGQQSGTFDIAQVQLEAGSVATPFERRPVGTELALCQRYFEVIPVQRCTGVTYTPNGDTRGGDVNCAVAKRAAPSLSHTGSTDVIAVGNAGDVINVTLGTLTLQSYGLNRIAISDISNQGAFTSVGSVISWGDNATGGLTYYADSEL